MCNGSGASASTPSEKYATPPSWSSMADKEKSKSISGLQFRAEYMGKLANNLAKEPKMSAADHKSVLDRLKTLQKDVQQKYKTSQESRRVSIGDRSPIGRDVGGRVKGQAGELERKVADSIETVEGLK